MRTRSFLSRLQNCLESIFMTSFTNRKAEEAPSPKVGSVSLSLSPLAMQCSTLRFLLWIQCRVSLRIPVLTALHAAPQQSCHTDLKCLLASGLRRSSLAVFSGRAPYGASFHFKRREAGEKHGPTASWLRQGPWLGASSKMAIRPAIPRFRPHLPRAHLRFCFRPVS